MIIKKKFYIYKAWKLAPDSVRMHHFNTLPENFLEGHAPLESRVSGSTLRASLFHNTDSALLKNPLRYIFFCRKPWPLFLKLVQITPITAVKKTADVKS